MRRRVGARLAISEDLAAVHGPNGWHVLKSRPADVFGAARQAAGRKRSCAPTAPLTFARGLKVMAEAVRSRRQSIAWS
jgi:hypothetical protein